MPCRDGILGVHVIMPTLEYLFDGLLVFHFSSPLRGDSDYFRPRCEPYGSAFFRCHTLRVTLVQRGAVRSRHVSCLLLNVRPYCRATLPPRRADTLSFAKSCLL